MGRYKILSCSRYTYYLLEFLEGVGPGSNTSLADLLKVCPPRDCISTVGVRTDLFPGDLHSTKVTDFFGSERRIEFTEEALDLPDLVSN
jgi:glycosylphosphatidylinositol transamidase (GPIT) subunit GPI8